MRLLCLLLLFFTISVHAQEWSLFAGAGFSYDGYLADKSVVGKVKKWPFEPGALVRGGIACMMPNGFNAFLTAAVGYYGLRQPIPATENSVRLNQLGLRLMAGCGPTFVDSKSNALTPFLQLGAGRFGDWDGVAFAADNNTTIRPDPSTDRRNAWSVVVGAGIDWRFAAKVPSGINLQFSYTPMNVFRDPLRYQADVNGATHDFSVQGKMLSCQLSYSVHWRFAGHPASDSY